VADSRLRNLELTGFKSFARRTEVILSGGVTGIVGELGVALGAEAPLEAAPAPPPELPWWRRTAEYRELA